MKVSLPFSISKDAGIDLERFILDLALLYLRKSICNMAVKTKCLNVKLQELSLLAVTFIPV